MAKKKVTITLNEETHVRLKRLALDKNKKVSELYEEVLEEGLRLFKEQSTLEDYKAEGVKTEEESEEAEI